MSTLDFCRRSRRPFFQKPHMAWISTRFKLQGETRFWKCNFGVPSREKHNRYICLIYGAVPIVVFKNFVKKSQHDMSERFEISLYIYKNKYIFFLYLYSTLGNTLNLYIPLMHIDMCRFRSSCVLLCRWHGHVWIHAGRPLGWTRAMSLILVNGCRLPYRWIDPWVLPEHMASPLKILTATIAPQVVPTHRHVWWKEQAGQLFSHGFLLLSPLRPQIWLFF